MAASSEHEPSGIRISVIAGRYLVFDPEAASLLRRTHNTCGNLVGTLPQQPVQNVFLGLPIEVRPEEAHALVQRGAAFFVDNVAVHKAALRNGAADRKKYIDGLRRKKQDVYRQVAEQEAEREARRAQMIAKSRKGQNITQQETPQRHTPINETQDDDSSVFAQPATTTTVLSSSETRLWDAWAVTPTTSNDLVLSEPSQDTRIGQASSGSMARFLQSSGYYVTPGLRFGCKFSVYPGDPLRFHAHFMANDYGWDEPIPILDIVEGGRLATAVKKSFLIGGKDQDEVSPSGDDNVRTYSLEWAGM